MGRFSFLIGSVGLFAIAVFSSHATTVHDPADQIQKQTNLHNLSTQPLAFTINQGQWDEIVKFRTNAGGATVWFSSEGAYYQFTRRIETKDNGQFSVIDKRSQLSPDVIAHESDSVETMMIKASFVGANPSPRMVGVDMLVYKCNYFIGTDPSDWHTDVPSYSTVMYEQIYDGIDLKYYGNGQQMEYDFIVSPGADYSQIEIHYEGAKSVTKNIDGDLVIRTEWGEIIERRPVIYQLENKKRILVDGSYLIRSDNSFGFELSNYNPALPLVIDPVLAYSTYLGGLGGEDCNGIAVDASGAAYLTGWTTSSDFPIMNPYQGTYQGGVDVFITKLSNTGNSLVYSTFVGGSDIDEGQGITVDTMGAVYVVGRTISTDFPIQNPYQGTLSGQYDAFVIKLSNAGNSLIYSTYLGGTDVEYATGIAVDLTGAAYVTGYTQSLNYPTLNPYQLAQGNTDVFVTKLSSAGNSLIYSTYFGGSSFEQPWGGIAIDASGSAYVTGITGSNDLPTLNAFQGAINGINDAFLMKLSITGNSLIYSTYLGGSSSESAYAIAVDNSGSAYITGSTESFDFPTQNPFQASHQGSNEIFFTKFSSAGNNLIYSSYLGGTSYDLVWGIAVDSSGSAYLSGRTGSSDFPILNPYQAINHGGIHDVFVTKLSVGGNSLIYSTFLGGSSNDLNNGIAVDGSGAAYVIGQTTSEDFPTQNPYQGSFQGTVDVYVAKFVESCCVGMTGNIDHDPESIVDISDLTFLIDHLFINFPPLTCPAEGNVDGDPSGVIDISDLTFLIDHLFINFPPTSECQ